VRDGPGAVTIEADDPGALVEQDGAARLSWLRIAIADDRDRAGASVQRVAENRRPHDDPVTTAGLKIADQVGGPIPWALERRGSVRVRGISERNEGVRSRAAGGAVEAEGGQQDPIVAA